jgi:2-methylfumaryl-CoA hydratase|tara:strand:+ start:6285 stop:7352 length:1068 start_codon:yes stop_codon:yes gene_type:complete
MGKIRQGNYFEDFRVGQKMVHPTDRTLIDADQSLYIGLTGSRSAVCSASSVAQRLGFPDKPLEDLLVFNVAFGKTVPDVSLNGVANLGYAEMRFLEPVYSGDTLSVESEVIGLRQNANGRSGIVYVRSNARNQHNRPVLSWVRWVMVHKRDETAPAPEEVIPDLSAYVKAADLPVTAWSPDRVGDLVAATGFNDLWEDYHVGERIDHPTAMTINDSDHSIATRLYQNTAKAHFDAAMMASTPMKARLVYGGHIMSICKSLSYDGLENMLAIVAINGGRHTAPSFAGDTICCATEVIDKIDLGFPHVGALRLRMLGAKNIADASAIKFPGNGKDDTLSPNIVLDLDYTVLVPRNNQ